MFKFLQKRREAITQREAATVLAACEAELKRTANANWRFVTAQRDIDTRSQLLQRAVLSGLGEHQTVEPEPSVSLPEQPGSLATGRGYFFALVGESHYQDQLHALLAASPDRTFTVRIPGIVITSSSPS